MDDLAKELNEGLAKWDTATVAEVRRQVCETIQCADSGILQVQIRPTARVHVTLVGVYHTLQWTELNGDETRQKRYQRIITEEVRHSLCAAVLEEAGDNESPSFAKRLADEHKVSYRNIDIGRHERATIKHIDINGPCLWGIAVDSNTMLENIYARAWNMVREYHMIQSVRNEVDTVMLSDKGGRVLVICGLSHLDAIRGHLPDGVTVGGNVFHEIAP